jgi:hypothetical protein
VNPGTYFFAITSAAVALFIVIEMLRRRRLRERHAIWWLVAGVASLVIAVFPQSIDGLASLIGVEEPVNLVFFSSLVILFVVGVQFSAELTSLENKTRRLAEEAAMQDQRIRALESTIRSHSK